MKIIVEHNSGILSIWHVKGEFIGYLMTVHKKSRSNVLDSYYSLTRRKLHGGVQNCKQSLM